MTLHDFVENYYLHDSFIESISQNEEHGSIEFIINFCYWMQDDFTEGSRETGLIELVFTGVKPPKLDLSKNYCDYIILKTNENDGQIVFALYDDISNDYCELSFEADDVTIEKKA